MRLVRFESASGSAVTYINPHSVSLIGTCETHAGCSDVHVGPGLWCKVRGLPDEVAEKLRTPTEGTSAT